MQDMFILFIKWLCKYCWNITELDHPTTATMYTTSCYSITLFINSDLMRIPRNPKKCGIVTSESLQNPDILIVEDFPVKVWSVSNARHDIALEGRWLKEFPFSSIIKLLCDLYFVISGKLNKIIITFACVDDLEYCYSNVHRLRTFKSGDRFINLRKNFRVRGFWCLFFKRSSM